MNRTDRRSFLKGAATGAAVLVASPHADAQQPGAGSAGVPAPSDAQLARDAGVRPRNTC